jgi:hypothetical protein
LTSAFPESARRATRPAPRRDSSTAGACLPLEASVRRRWRESLKRSSASVRAGVPCRGKARVTVGAGQMVLGHKRSRQMRGRADRESDHNRVASPPSRGGVRTVARTRTAAGDMKSDETLICGRTSSVPTTASRVRTCCRSRRKRGHARALLLVPLRKPRLARAWCPRSWPSSSAGVGRPTPFAATKGSRLNY